VSWAVALGDHHAQTIGIAHRHGRLGGNPTVTRP
jgi:hypothetical protein